jgi:hypothetical protein
MRRTTVPEATVNEHGETKRGKNEVRPAGQRDLPAPTGDPEPPE